MPKFVKYIPPSGKFVLKDSEKELAIQLNDSPSTPDEGGLSMDENTIGQIKGQKASIEQRLGGNDPTIKPQTVIVDDVGSGRVRTEQLYCDGNNVAPLFSGGYIGVNTGGADVNKQNVQPNRKAWILHNNSSHNLRIGEHTDALTLQKKGFKILANQPFSSAFFKGNVNIIAEDVTSDTCEILLWVEEN